MSGTHFFIEESTMDILSDYLLEMDTDGYSLILYINPSNTEFASEIFDTTKEISKNLKEWIINWSSAQAPRLKIHTVRVMLGTFLLITIHIPFQLDNNSSNSQVYAQTNDKFNMSYLYFGSPSTHVDRVLRTNNSLKVVSPSYFNLNENGNLELTPLLDSNFINEMHNRGIKVVPFLSNHWDKAKGIKALENRDQLVNDLVVAIEVNNLDGINIDIENVTPAQKEMYVDFIKQLRERLPSDKEVSVAVAANPNGYTTGWQGSYDYAELGRYADYLMIMAYDESSYGSEPGPVASHDFVERSIQYALKHVPAEKVVLGISFYGRYWNVEKGIKGNGIHLTKVQELLSAYENTITYDNKYQSPKAVIKVKAGDPPIQVFGKPLASGTYTIWYENADSIKAKLMLVQKYNIKGTGSWSLGQEHSDVWMYYDLWLNSKYFEDINQSWAKDEILTIVQREVMTGMTETKFSPTGTLTRAQAATVLVRAFKLQSLDQEIKAFIDVPTTHWAKENIDTIVSHGIMEGISIDTFSPDEPLTREQMAMLLYRVLEQQPSTSVGTSTFTDVESGRWSEEAIHKMTLTGIYKGYPDNTFRPAKSMERQEMATLMNRVLDKNE
ncbi:MAG: glycoside hydrolase [Firmicutes bacterium HGW-Firmicutes-1]|jgi:spore germination protein YaaH|nr:MAG: glycoside hydrolase [Firmicutes bacterium HGW-Firmicutes-1]